MAVISPHHAHSHKCPLTPCLSPVLIWSCSPSRLGQRPAASLHQLWQKPVEPDRQSCNFKNVYPFVDFTDSAVELDIVTIFKMSFRISEEETEVTRTVSLILMKQTGFSKKTEDDI